MSRTGGPGVKNLRADPRVRENFAADYLGPQHSGVDLSIDPADPLPFGVRPGAMTAEEQANQFAFVRDLNGLAAVEYPEDDQLRARIRAWEDSAYAGYDSIVRRLAERSRREAVADTTDPTGRAILELRGGPWWIYARSWDATDPNAEWYWNVPVRGDTVVLDPGTGKRRVRY